MSNSEQVPVIAVGDLTPDVGFTDRPVARGIAGLPLEKTPAVKGAKRGHIECDVNVDALAYWNDPPGKLDESFDSPFRVEVSHGACGLSRFAPCI